MSKDRSKSTDWHQLFDTSELHHVVWSLEQQAKAVEAHPGKVEFHIQNALRDLLNVRLREYVNENHRECMTEDLRAAYVLLEYSRAISDQMDAGELEPGASAHLEFLWINFVAEATGPTKVSEHYQNVEHGRRGGGSTSVDPKMVKVIEDAGRKLLVDGVAPRNLVREVSRRLQTMVGSDIRFAPSEPTILKYLRLSGIKKK